jgi:hypothetical protein
MVGTVGAARRLGGRIALTATAAAFAIGLAVGAAAVFGALGLVGSAVHGRAVVVIAFVVAAVAAIADAAGLRVRPQVHFQVPERWRRTMPLPRAVFLYGVLLGTGLTTYVPAAAAWALLPLSLALGNVGGALAVGISFALGRAVPVLVLAVRGEETALAERPQGLRILRCLTAVALLAALVAGEAHAATTVASPGADPSAAGADVAWQQPGIGGFLLRSGQAAARLPGNDPAIGGLLVAWHSGSSVTVAARDTLAPAQQETIPGVQKLAVSDQWLVYRAAQADGGAQIRAQALTDLSRSARVTSVRHGASLGRPYLSGDLVVYHYATAGRGRLTAVDVATGARRILRSSDTDQLLNPSLLGARLLYVRESRCSQQLRLGPLGSGKEHVLYELPPLAGQDLGHERRHTSQGEHLPCPGRPRPTSKMLWTTALSATTAYVTILTPRRGGRTTPSLLAVARR